MSDHGTCFNSSVGRARGWKPRGHWFDPNLKHMVSNYRLLFKYILFTKQPFKLLEASALPHSTLALMVRNHHLFYLFMHIRLASWFYSSQLIELFSYEAPTPVRVQNGVFGLTPIHVYNFSSTLQQSRVIIFSSYGKKGSLRNTASVSDLFLNAWWLERELSEMSGFAFGGQRDSRNLLLMYGDTSMPILKAFPSIGVRELFFDATVDTLIQVPVTVQF